MKIFKSVKLISMLLAMLGFAGACKNNSVKYGSPEADFILNGTVKSLTSLQPIAGINIKMNGYEANTNSNGTFTITIRDFPEDQEYPLLLHDNDSMTDGHFLDKDSVAVFPGINFTGGDGEFYEGTEEINMEIKMYPKP